ncbi:hypothetical protein N2152v2_008334 [Parachlorella kessleri]
MHARNSVQRQQQRHDTYWWASILSVLEALSGPSLCLLSNLYFAGSARALGVLLGLFVSAAGVLGVAASLSRNVNLLSGHILGSILAAVLLFNFVSHVSLDTRADCAFAELQLLQRQARASLQTNTQPQHLMASIKMRLDALDSTLDLLSNEAHSLVGVPAASSHSATKDAAAEELLKHHQRELWRAADAHFVAEKLKQLKEHGLQVMHQLAEHGQGGAKLGALQKVVGARMTAADEQELKEKFTSLFASTQELVSRIEAHEQGNVRIDPADYERLIGSMEHSMTAMATFIRDVEAVLGREGTPVTHAEFQKMMHGMDPLLPSPAPPGRQELLCPPLQHAKEDLGVMTQALARQDQSDAYTQLDAQHVGQLKQAWRDKWDSMLEEVRQGKPADEALAAIASMGSAYSANLAQHCVTGMVGLRYVKAAAVILIIIQAASIHQAFTVAEKEAAKRRRME